MATIAIVRSCAGGGHLQVRVTLEGGKSIDMPMTLDQFIGGEREDDKRVAVVLENARTACRLAGAKDAAEVAAALAARTFQE